MNAKCLLWVGHGLPDIIVCVYSKTSFSFTVSAWSVHVQLKLAGHLPQKIGSQTRKNWLHLTNSWPTGKELHLRRYIVCSPHRSLAFEREVLTKLGPALKFPTVTPEQDKMYTSQRATAWHFSCSNLPCLPEREWRISLLFTLKETKLPLRFSNKI